MIALLLSLLARDCPPPVIPDASAVTLRTDVIYRIRGGDTLRLDVARPLRPGAPVVLLVHGGGWRGGDRASRLRDQLLRLAGQGYAAASIDYRLTTDRANRYPAAMQDVVCAVRWLRREQRSLGVDAERMVVMGESAGAQLASLLGTRPTDPTYAHDCDGDAVRVRGVISMFGILDLRHAEPGSRVAQAIDAYLASSTQAAAASPIMQVSSRSTPFLLVHGTADSSVAPIESQRMREALGRASVPATYVEVPGQGHGFPMLSETPELRTSTCAALAFLQDRLGASPPRADPVLRMRAGEYAFTMPERVEAGATTVRLVNEGKEPHYALFYRLGDGHGGGDFLAWRHSRTAPPAWLTLLTGPAPVMPGDSTDMSMTLAPGRYVVMCGYPDRDRQQHVDKGMMRELLVTPGAVTAERQVPNSARLVLADGGFRFTTPLRSGRHALAIENTGNVARQALLVRLPDGVTLADEMRWFDAGFATPRPALPSGGALRVAPNSTVTITRTFIAGRWAVLSHTNGPWETLEFRIDAKR